jgi:branched-chain amino acid transport system ATP-binding protein
MLRVSGIEASYSDSQVLFGVSFDVGPGEVVTLLGRNGMGKTTTIRTLMGILKPRRGEVTWDGARVQGLAPFRLARLGLGLVPEGRQVFPNLTVRENLIATATKRGTWTLAAVLELFPQLGERLHQPSSLLSGGEQQMLAIGRALLTNPRLLILDEATEGLAPLLRREIWQALEKLKAQGQSILLIDKNIAALCRISNRHYILEKGRVVWTGTSDELLAAGELQRRYLGV